MRIVIYCLFIVLISQGCNQSSRKQTQTPVDIEQQARSYFISGDYIAAADEYTNLANKHPLQAVYFQLRTTDSLLRAHETQQARNILKFVDATTPNDKLYKDILSARISLIDNDAGTALNILNQEPGEQSRPELMAARLQTRADAFELGLNFFKAAEARIEADNHLLDPALRLINIRAIWEDVNHIPLNTLNELHNSSGNEFNAWIELAIINKTQLFKPLVLEQSLESWRQQYPNHMAVSTIPPEILALSRTAFVTPEHIAILLPLSGQYENAAHAIRDGFLSAWYEDSEKKAKISIYDANALNIKDKYEQALRNGADFVVGPLEKRAIESLISSAEIKVTTLALNQTDPADPDSGIPSTAESGRLIQFALAPEDEARQVAERAIFDGHNKALVLTPANDWGSRLAQAFSDAWNALGGRVLEYVPYESASRDFSTPVKKLLNIDTSAHRASKLRQKLSRNLKSEPRLREDADMIFMAAVPLVARQIVPQFRFYRADDIQVYSSSHAYSGIEDAEANSDMNNILFTDIPAVLDYEVNSSSLHQAVNRNWAADTSTYRRLFALGMDAYQLIPHIGKLSLQKTAVFKGQTGDLYMTADKRIYRKLLWARFINGKARLLPAGSGY